MNAIQPLLSPLAIAGMLLGLAIIALGLWLLKADSSRERYGKGFSEPTWKIMGLCAMLTGYHVISYTAPDAWLPFRVPPDRWYFLAGGIAAAIWLSRLADAREQVSQDGNDESSDPRH